MMQSSQLMSFIYEYIIKNISSNVSDVEFLKNKNNVKYVTLCICLLFASSLIGMLSYFLFYVMFFFSSLKCILWLFESYNPKSINVFPSIKNKQDKLTHYMSNSSSSDVLEYYVVPTFIYLTMYPMALIPVPGLTFIIYGLSVILSLGCITVNSYRQKYCLFIRDTFTDKLCRDNDGNYIPGNEGEFHKFLQTLCYSIDCIFITTYNLTHKPLVMINQLAASENITQAIGVITSNIEKIIHNIDTNNIQSNQKINMKKNKHNNIKKRVTENIIDAVSIVIPPECSTDIDDTIDEDLFAF
jgi:hypothetical protein